MPAVVIEHIMLSSLLIIVLITFPVIVNTAIITYVHQQRDAVIQGALNRLTGTVQQLSYSLARPSIHPGNVTLGQPLPTTIDSQWYIITSSPESDESVTFSLYLPGLDHQINETITLDSYSKWKISEYSSLDPTAAVNVEKFSNGTLQFSFI